MIFNSTQADRHPGSGWQWPQRTERLRSLRWILGTWLFLVSLMVFPQAITIPGATLSGPGLNGNPIYRSSAGSGFNWSRSVQLYTAADLAGMPTNSQIDTIAFSRGVGGTLSAGRTATLNIYMRNSASTALVAGSTWASMISSATLIYSNSAVSSADFPAAAGLVRFAENQVIPFVYTGGSLEVYIDWVINAGAGNPTTGSFQWNYATSTNNQAMGGSAGTPGFTGAETGWALQLRRYAGRIAYSPAPACTGTPTPGATLPATSTVCPEATVILSLANFTPGTGVSYAWEVSTVSSSGPWSPIGGSTPTLSANPAQQSWYQCTVSCSGGGSQTSTPAQVDMDPTFTNPQDFSAGVINNGCWSAAGAGLAYAAQSGFGVGAGSARWNFFNTGAGVSQTLTSPYFTAVPSGWRVRFDVAGQEYDDGGLSIDTIRLEEWNGSSWVLLQLMTNSVGDALNTAGASTGAFTPTAVQWATRNYSLTPGATRIRFRGTSGFGNNVHIDNITVEETPVCLTPEDVVGVATTFTTATISWTDNGAVDYNLEIRSSGAPGSGPAGLEVSETGLLGSPYLASGLPPNTNLQAYVQGNCGPNGLSGWSVAGNFITDYCETSVDFIDELINNVTVSNINNSSTGDTGYEDFSGGTPIQMAPGVNYPFTVGIAPLYTGDEVLIWVDLNNDLDFADVNELRYTSLALPVSGQLSVPAGTPAGQYRMRVRLHWTGGGPNNTPCGTSGYGEVEDYTINVCSAPEAIAYTFSVCESDYLEAEVLFSSFGSGGEANSTVTFTRNSDPSVTVTGSGILVNSIIHAAILATTADTFHIEVGNGTLCTLDLGDWFSNCPDTLNCGTVASHSYCYKNNDSRKFHYVAAPGQTVTLNFISGTLDLGDAVNFYDGPNNLALSLGGGNFGGDLSSADFVSTGRDLYFEINSTNGTNSCFDGGQGTPWQWEVLCTPDCTPPTGLVEYVTPISCTPPGFNLAVTIFSAGAAGAGGSNPLSIVDLEWSGGASGSLDDVAEGATVQIGPFPLDANMNIVIAHDQNPLCDLNMGIFSQASTCPPPNDDCVNAQVMTIAGIEGCPGGAVNGTTAYGTDSSGGSIPAPSCNNTAGTIQDVWYTFNTGLLGSPISFTLNSGSIVNYAVSLYQAGVSPADACVGTLIGCLTGSPGDIIFTNAPQNTTYYLRVFTNTSTGTAGTFDICMSGSACPAPTGVVINSITSESAEVSWTGPAGSYYVEYGPSASFTTPGTGSSAGSVNSTVVPAASSPITITGLDPSTNYVVFVRRDCGAPDGFSFNSQPVLFVTSPPPTVVTQSTCDLNVAIPDDGCLDGNSLSAEFSETTAGTLGVDLVLESVDLIVTHTWRSDLEIRLVSPNGTVRDLIVGRGGSDDDFGDVLNCPTGVLKLRDGAASLGTLPLSNATVGTYAPEDLLSSFSGPSNGDWQLVICDGFGGDTGELEYVKLNFATCVGPTYTTTIVPACGSNQYSVSVDVTGMGSAASYNLINSLSANVVGIPGTGSYSAGPFDSGTSVNLTLVHNANAACNATTSGITFTCPPANDDCANAIAISCNSVTLGSTLGANNTDNPGTCVTTLGSAPGVWYTVQGWGGTMTASTCDIAAFDTKLGVFTGSCGTFTCVTGNDDDFTCPDSFVSSLVSWSSVAGTTYYIYVTGFGANAGAFALTLTCGDVAPPPCAANGLSIEIEPDANTAQTSWDIVPQGLSVSVCSGAGPYISGSVIPEYCCLPDGCYRFRVFDDAGDGITDGGYMLRTMTTGFRIIDNTDNFTTGTQSAISTTVAGGNFCLPIGADKLTNPSCDKLNWTPNTYIIASANAAVSAEWIVNGANNVQDANSGYEFWIFDPNGSYSFRRFRSHNVSDGFSPASATRACHMKINSWTNTVATPHIPLNKLLNVRVRGRVNGMNNEFGPACQFYMVGTVTCPQVSLQNDPNNVDFSCGVTRPYLPGQNNGQNRIVARPPQFVPANVPSSSVRYQFRFRLPAEGICIIRPAQTSATLLLNWQPGTGNNAPLQCGKQYDVEVRVSRNGGASWCVDANSVTCASPYVQWGPVCKVTITACPSAITAAPASNTYANSTLALYPNPNSGEQLFMNMTDLNASVTAVNVDVFDLTGKRVIARQVAAQDGYVNSTLDIRGLSGGVYLVNITAGDRTFTERLVIQP